MRRAVAIDFDAVVSGLRTAALDEAVGPLLDATSALIAEHGVRGWTISDVAKRAGVGRATVYRRFESRDEIVQAALAREARRFFTVIANAVEEIPDVADQVVEGFLIGLRLVRVAPIQALMARDPAAALSLLTSDSMVAEGRRALLDAYTNLHGPLEDPEGPVVAEALVRLGLSWVLVPATVIDLEDAGAARKALGRIIRPMLAGVR